MSADSYSAALNPLVLQKAERFERADPWIGMRKEEFGEDQTGHGRIEEEVVPFDGRADGGGDHGAAKLHLVFGGGQGSGIGVTRWHLGSP